MVPIINVTLLGGVVSAKQKTELLRNITEAVVTTLGEPVRPLTVVHIHESGSGEIAFGGEPLTVDHVKQTLSTSTGTAAD